MEINHFIDSEMSNEELLKYREEVEQYKDEESKNTLLEDIDKTLKKRGLK